MNLRHTRRSDLAQTPGPYGAPRDNGSDVRWSADFLTIASTHPELLPNLLGVCSQAWDQGAHEHANGKGNPFWGLDTEAADALTAKEKQ